MTERSKTHTEPGRTQNLLKPWHKRMMSQPSQIGVSNHSTSSNPRTTTSKKPSTIGRPGLSMHERGQRPNPMRT